MLEVTSTESLVISKDSSVIIASPKSEEVLVTTTGPQGPQGPEASSTLEVTFQSLENLSAFAPVYLSSSFSVRHALNTDPLLNSVVGLTKTSVIIGSTVTVILDGLVTNPGFSFVPNFLVYLSPTGSLTQIPPSTGLIQILGTAISNDTILFKPKQPIKI